MAEIELVDEFFYLSLTDSCVCVSRGEAQKIEDQLNQHTLLLKFDTLSGKQFVCKAEDFLHMSWSTPEARAHERQHNKMIEDEERADRNWSQIGD